ncbi:hypothetical protein H7849_23825 [Alloacidobacterium dinghuense]|uniref:Uncharacterized protein n=1 Tax=Alloacidobacterium dinghuense TaxID=2763107 RepID=A0A7G8BHI5_9BACT|nr:hypothetical protein [Alloacidobacterium dinghuense]QNI32005.1 hypothetical protein H7849_23825 [Alloacidobacterium dinghuense]
MKNVDEVIAEIRTRFDKLDAAAAAIQVSSLQIRQCATGICIAADASSPPPKELKAELHQVITVAD